MRTKALLPALLAVGLALSILGDVGDAHGTYDDLVAWGKRVLKTGEHGLSNQELYFVVGIVVLAFFLLLIQGVLRDSDRESERDRAARDQRRAILDEPDARRRYLRWLKLDVENRLKESVHGAVLLDLGMEEDEDAARPWFLRATSSEGPREFPNFEVALERFHHRVLLLGGPGSGKTTTLLDAMLKAASRALQEEAAPIPVYFNLSSFSDRPVRGGLPWRHRERPEEALTEDGLTYRDVDDLEHQMIVQMSRLPSTDFDLCRRWIRQGQVGLFLDGLDEVPEAYAKKLVQQINHGYCKRFTDRPLVVASRIIEYRTLQGSSEGGLKVDGAVTLQPLAVEQIQEYLSCIQDADGLRAALKDGATLQELASSPLTLSMMTLAYAGRSRGEIPSHASLPQQRRSLFDAFVPKMMQRHARRTRGKIFSLDAKEDVPTPYSVESVNRYLGWFAVRLSERMRTLFSVRHLYEILRPKGQRGEWDLTLTTDVSTLGLFSFLGALYLGLAEVSTFPFPGVLALLFGLGMIGLMLGTYGKRFSEWEIPAWLSLSVGVPILVLVLISVAVCTLAFAPLAPDGWNPFLLSILAAFLIWAISGVVFAFTKHSPQKDEVERRNRWNRLDTLKPFGLGTLAGVGGGVVGIVLWWLFASGSVGFTWAALGALIGLALALFLFAYEGGEVAFFAAGALLLIWGASLARIIHVYIVI